MNTQTQKQASEVFFDFEFIYHLTKSGQRTHLLNGGNGKETQEITGQISLENAERLGERFENGRLSRGYETIRTDKRMYVGGDFAIAEYDNALTFDEAVAEAIRWAQLRAERLIEEKKLKEETTAQRKAEVELAAVKQKEADEEESRRAEAKRQQIADWVDQHGNDNQKQRYAAGLFPEQEATQAIKDATFAPAGDWPVYDSIQATEVRATCFEHCGCTTGYENCEVSFSSEVADSVSADEWEQIQKLQALLPTAEIKLKQHKGQCEDRDCDPDEGEGIVERKGLYAKIVVGGFTFNREFAL